MAHLLLTIIGKNGFNVNFIQFYSYLYYSSIENLDGKLYVTPENSDFETYLNGELVNGKKEMFHGDRLVIGGSHFFRVSNPFCVQKDKKRKVSLIIINIHYQVMAYLSFVVGRLLSSISRST